MKLNSRVGDKNRSKTVKIQDKIPNPPIPEERKKAAKDALSEALSKFERMETMSKSLYLLLANNFEFLSWAGDIGHGPEDKAFTAGIYFLVDDFSTRSQKTHDKVRAAAHSVYDLV
jgi:hypothetical protein